MACMPYFITGVPEVEVGLLLRTSMLEAAGDSQGLGYTQVFPKAWASWAPATCSTSIS